MKRHIWSRNKDRTSLAWGFSRASLSSKTRLSSGIVDVMAFLLNVFLNLCDHIVYGWYRTLKGRPSVSLGLTKSTPPFDIVPVQTTGDTVKVPVKTSRVISWSNCWEASVSIDKAKTSNICFMVKHILRIVLSRVFDQLTEGWGGTGRRGRRTRMFKKYANLPGPTVPPLQQWIQI